MRGNAEETGKNSVTLKIDPDMLGDTKKKGKPKENSFTSTDLILSMSSTLDFSEENNKKSEVERFIGKMDLLCSSLAETRKDNSGFYWNYYVPYFTEMKTRKMIATFSYLTFAATGDNVVLAWLKSHQDDVDQFYLWSKAFTWKSD